MKRITGILLVAALAVLAACAPAVQAEQAQTPVVPAGAACEPTPFAQLTPDPMGLKVLIVSEDTGYKNKCAQKIYDVLALYGLEPVVATEDAGAYRAADFDAVAVMWPGEDALPDDVHAAVENAGDTPVLYLDTTLDFGTASEAVIKQLGIELEIFYPKQC